MRPRRLVPLRGKVLEAPTQVAKLSAVVPRDRSPANEAWARAAPNHGRRRTSTRRTAGSASSTRSVRMRSRTEGSTPVDANLALGFRDDERDYAVAAHMLASLTIGSVRLLTNNPNKVADLERHGIRVSARARWRDRPQCRTRFRCRALTLGPEAGRRVAPPQAIIDRRCCRHRSGRCGWRSCRQTRPSTLRS
jgi:hypothetical protein